MNCPICAEETVAKYRPFCSRRCADRDLANWFNGGYTIPSQDTEDIENAAEEAETPQSKPH